MKREHEDKFSGVIEKMKNSVKDYGIVNQYSKALTCKKMSDVMEFGCTDEESLENAKVINGLIDKLIDVPIETRSLLAVMVARSFDDAYGNCVVPIYEIESATGKDASFIINHMGILNRRGVVSEADVDEYGRPYCNLCEDNHSGWNYWGDMSHGANGMVFKALINKLGTIPKSEMAEVRQFDALPDNLTYPAITSVLFNYLVQMNDEV